MHLAGNEKDEIGADSEVIVDSAVRCGTDVVIARALAARVVGLVCCCLHGLASV